MPPESVNPKLDRLKSNLMTSGLQQRDNATFQVISQLIDYLRSVGIIVNNISSGSSGSSGATGATGPQGPPGIGFSGEDGDDGVGFPGNTGPQGPSGAAGPSGPSGLTIVLDELDGEPGDIGPQGNQGPTGPQGPAGSSSAELLYEGSGTDSTTTPVDVDSFGVTGLTVKDSLYIIANFEVDGAHTLSSPQLYNPTDSVRMVLLHNGSMGGGSIEGAIAWLTVRQGSTILTCNNCFNAQGGSQGQQTTLTTLWTGSWTLAFRHNGVSAGGTMKWRWAVYKIQGQ